ncbi:hypothetical protein PHSC3_000336 [Chlamydiales bacterium STE3]|nr:hypothetical protein PHSC3_000336 [Chlamydiales bacterium STE3]
MMSNPMMKVLFVCLGNICRSPAAEGMLRHLADMDGSKIHVESCGLGDWHLGSLPDMRIRSAAKARGVVLSSRAKIFKKEYLDNFDYILAADHEVLEHLHRFAADPQHKAKIHLMTAFGNAYQGLAIPDPFYGGDIAFEYTLDILEDACLGLIEEIKKAQK